MLQHLVTPTSAVAVVAAAMTSFPSSLPSEAASNVGVPTLLASPISMPQVTLSTPSPVAPSTQQLTPISDDSVVSTNAVSIKCPPYWPQDPILWFARVEAMFRSRGITAQRTMFDHVVGSLEHQFATDVRDVLLSPPSTNPYNILKSELIKRTQASPQQRLRQLLTLEELGDRKPSQLLRHLQQLLGDTVMEESLLRELFVHKLPSSVQMVIASTPDSTSIVQLAELADRIIEVSDHSRSSVSLPVSEVSSESPGLLELSAQVASLTAAVARLTKCRSDPSLPGEPRASSPSDSTTGWCYYHRRFGAKAKKCQKPCSFRPENSNARA